jgi:hypothetical protein
VSVWRSLVPKRHQERVVHASLQREGIPPDPLVSEWPRPAVGAAVVPMFQGYVFCRPAANQLERAAATNGVASLVRFGDRSPGVPPAVMGDLRSRAYFDGTISPDLGAAARKCDHHQGAASRLDRRRRTTHDRPPAGAGAARPAPAPRACRYLKSVVSARMTPRVHPQRRLHLRTGQ